MWSPEQALVQGCMQSAPPKVNLAREMRYEGAKWQLETYDTDELLGKAFYFFECQESGKLRQGHRVKWRGDSYLHDGKREGIDLVGGWHDAGGGNFHGHLLVVSGCISALQHAVPSANQSI